MITVDWSRGTRGIRYDKSTANTRVVGATVGKMVEALMKNAGVSLGNVHLIGHSLGAQIMGYAGKELRHLGKVGRITGKLRNSVRMLTEITLPGGLNIYYIMSFDEANSYCRKLYIIVSLQKKIECLLCG